MTSKEKTNLPALASGYKSFIIKKDDDIELPEELLAEISEEDNQFFEASLSSLPFVSIRQKDLKNDKGKVETPAGGFKYSNVDFEVDDADGDKGLVVSVLADQNSRVYFASLDEKRPTCKSVDGKVGVGTPGGSCLTCSLAQWEGDKTPECHSQMNLFCFDHTIGSAYVLNLGRSALKHWGKFKNFIKSNKVKGPNGPVSLPLCFVKILITTEYVAEPAPHFVPKFTMLEAVSVELIKLIKSFRDDHAELFRKEIETVDIRDESENGHSQAIDAEYDELPDGVTPVKDGYVHNEKIPGIGGKQNKQAVGNDDLPF